MLVQVCRLLATRGGWGPRTGEYGFYGVMGPDEFQMMVNGFGGMRSDGDMLEFAPSIPSAWNSYSFHVLSGEAVLGFTIDREKVRVTSTNAKPARIKIYDTTYDIDGTLTVDLRK